MIPPYDGDRKILKFKEPSSFPEKLNFKDSFHKSNLLSSREIDDIFFESKGDFKQDI